jgi:hypothetical protein
MLLRKAQSPLGVNFTDNKTRGKIEIDTEGVAKYLSP